MLLEAILGGEPGIALCALVRLCGQFFFLHMRPDVRVGLLDVSVKI